MKVEEFFGKDIAAWVAGAADRENISDFQIGDELPEGFGQILCPASPALIAVTRTAAAMDKAFAREQSRVAALENPEETAAFEQGIVPIMNQIAALSQASQAAQKRLDVALAGVDLTDIVAICCDGQGNLVGLTSSDVFSLSIIEFADSVKRGEIRL